MEETARSVQQALSILEETPLQQTVYLEIKGFEFPITKFRGFVKIWADVEEPLPPIRTSATEEGLKAAVGQLVPSLRKHFLKKKKRRSPSPQRPRTVPAKTLR